MHTPLNSPSDPTLLAFGIPKHFRESEMNNNNNNIPPSEDLHNTHMRRYEIKSEGLLNIHPRLSKKTCPSFLPIIDLIAYKEKTRIPACGVVLYMEVGSHQTKEKEKKKKKKRRSRLKEIRDIRNKHHLPPPVLVRGKGKEKNRLVGSAVQCIHLPLDSPSSLVTTTTSVFFAKQKPR